MNSVLLVAGSAAAEDVALLVVTGLLPVSHVRFATETRRPEHRMVVLTEER